MASLQLLRNKAFSAMRTIGRSGDQHKMSSITSWTRSSRSVAPFAENQITQINSFSTAAASPSDRERAFQAEGILDERALTVFDTLHEMQVRSCRVYADNDLFGTYNGKAFEWMTYQEYANNVDKCRAVLHDLGTFHLRFISMTAVIR
jgi:hypothetical protein